MAKSRVERDVLSFPASNPYGVVDEFERQMADYAGSAEAVAVDSGSSAIFLSLHYHELLRSVDEARRGDTEPSTPEVVIPKQTFCGVAGAVCHNRLTLKFTSKPWLGHYWLSPYPVVDACCWLQKDMYHQILLESPDSRPPSVCLSFQYKKPLPIGRGGMILLEDKQQAEWLRMARWHGRDLDTGEAKFMGWHMKMEPERAARGLEMMTRLSSAGEISQFDYPDLSQMQAYKWCNAWIRAKQAA